MRLIGFMMALGVARAAAQSDGFTVMTVVVILGLLMRCQEQREARRRGVHS